MSLIGRLNVGDTTNGLFIGTVNINNLDASNNSILYSSDGKRVQGANKLIYNDASGNLNASGTIAGGTINSSGAINASGTIAGGSLSADTGTISTTGTIAGGTVNSSGAINASGTITGGSLSAGTGTISTTGTISGGTVNSSGAINASGTITGGSLSAGTGNISTTGTVSGGTVNSSGAINASGTITGATLVGTNLTVNGIAHTNMAKYIYNDFSNSAVSANGASITYFSTNVSGFTVSKKCIFHISYTFYTNYSGNIFYTDLLVDGTSTGTITSYTNLSMCHLYQSTIIAFTPTSTTHTISFKITAAAGGTVYKDGGDNFSYVIYQLV